MATARKTDEIVCDLLSRGLLGEEALRSCRLAAKRKKNPSPGKNMALNK